MGHGVRGQGKFSFSARTTWGVFRHKGAMCAIVLECWYDKVSYPELRKIAQEAHDEWEPDAVLIEKKGVWPIFVARFAYGWRASFGLFPSDDKEARAHAISALGGWRIYLNPTQSRRKWAKQIN